MVSFSLYLKKRVDLHATAGWTDKFRGDYFPADDGIIKLVRQEPIG
jgi:hypothetical protein